MGPTEEAYALLDFETSRVISDRPEFKGKKEGLGNTGRFDDEQPSPLINPTIRVSVVVNSMLRTSAVANGRDSTPVFSQGHPSPIRSRKCGSQPSLLFSST
ncbi:uncharacterized protein MYCFIDRAFT_175335 [Pseudocercospora fijiensis CIRAD86]|uniref:Uncharacterized protein n=1 Tax=Pseudocercospora fijiensis (strain CIRAD86) TaxID=383855 RepID=M3AXF4_PSEFD|nr:uncharacterized protein MYCFIDRAFT_175335 [Pseudocercospora fijiensis CIRAD86]EME81758.1 hypothetical protein MYCFIDRAFT_175335 [Pseudocercospora fijiensis CIRAD86]